MNARHYDILFHKAQSLHEAGCVDAALELFRELEGINPADPKVQYELGMLCMELLDNRTALRHFQELVRLAPDFSEGRLLLGMIHGELGQHDEAIACLLGVLAEFPDLAEVHHRLGQLFADKQCYKEAYNEYQQVLRIEPDHLGVLCSLGVLLTATGHISDARSVLLQALERDPDSVNVINNLGRICGVGKSAESLQWYQRGLDIDPENMSLTSNYLYQLNYTADLTPEYIADKYKVYAPRCYYPRKKWQRPARIRGQNQPVRIGYLSADLYAHSVAFFLEPILQYHDHSRFEIYCYSNRTVEDETTGRLKMLSTAWRVVYGLADEQVAELIAADGIDILVDLSGHTAGNRLGVLVYRPAPVQASWIGHPNTTGLSQVDYYLTDPLCDPPGTTEHLFSEKLLRLPRVFSCYLPPMTFPVVAPPPVCKCGYITFGCFNSIAKINEPLISWWAALLTRVPQSRLLIKGPKLDDQQIRQQLTDLFERNGISSDRIGLFGLTGTRDEHLALYSRVDIALDTYPYNGTTTTCESLWMGVPVVTLAGKTHVSRVGLSFLDAIGCHEFVADNPEGYIAKAALLANDQKRLVELRETLRLMMTRSPLMDYMGVTRELEDAYMAMISSVISNV